MREQGEVGRGEVLGCEATFPGLTQNATNAGVGVLHIVDRVLLALRARQRQVEVEMRIHRAREQEKASDVGADVLDQLAQGYDHALALGHLLDFAALRQAHHLVNDELGHRGVNAGGGHPRLDARHLRGVVGAPDIDQVLEPPRQLVLGIGEVGHKVGFGAVPAHQHPVLLVPEVGGAQPQRAVLLVEHPARPQILELGLDRAGGEELALTEPGVEADAEHLEGLADLGDHQVLAQDGELQVAVRLLRDLAQALALTRNQLAGEVNHILAGVAVFRHVRGQAEQLTHPRLQRCPEQAELVIRPITGTARTS